MLTDWFLNGDGPSRVRALDHLGARDVIGCAPTVAQDDSEPMKIRASAFHAWLTHDAAAATTYFVERAGALDSIFIVEWTSHCEWHFLPDEVCAAFTQGLEAQDPTSRHAHLYACACIGLGTPALLSVPTVTFTVWLEATHISPEAAAWLQQSATLPFPGLTEDERHHIETLKVSVESRFKGRSGHLSLAQNNEDGGLSLSRKAGGRE